MKAFGSYANLIITLILFLPLKSGFSQPNTDAIVAPTLFDAIYPQEIEKVELTVDLDSLLMNKLTNKEHPALLKVFFIEGENLELPLKVSVRSRSRRRYCVFPPLKFNFAKGNLDSLGFDREDDYKIVTHCLEETATQESLLKEFMMYQLYRIITPITLRAKLIDIVYYDVNSDYKLEKKAIFLESEDEFAKRQNAESCNCMGTPPDSIDAFTYELIAMFQYMIGNADMDHKVERNVKLLKPNLGGPWIPVAYDFDYASLVNAPYVYKKINDNRSIRTKYLGFKENAGLLDSVRDHFKEKKDAIIELVKNFEGLEKADRRACLQYIRTFYIEIENPNFKANYKD